MESSASTVMVTPYSMNRSMSFSDITESPDWYITMLLVSFFVITIPNAILLTFLCRTTSLWRNTSNHFIVSFTFSDLMTGMLVFPLGLIHEIEYSEKFRHENITWITRKDSDGVSNLSINNMDDIGEGFCDLLQASITFLGYISVFHMGLIAGDRFYRITRPIRYKRLMTRRRAKYTCLSLWVFCLCLSYFFYWHYKKSGIPHDPSQCVFYITTNYFVYIFAMTVGIIPMIIMFYYYVKLIILSRYAFKSSIPIEVEMSKREGRVGVTVIPVCLTRRRPSSDSDSEEEYQEVLDPRYPRSESDILELKARMKRVRRSKRAAILVGLIIAGYVVSVVPSSIVYILYTFFKEDISVHKTPYFYLYPWMTFFNSAYNPFIYFFLTKELRTAVCRWFRKKFGYAADEV